VATDAPDYGFYRFDDFCKLPSDGGLWCVKPIIPQGGWVNLYGQPKKARKSYLALGAAWAVSSGQSSWLGFDVLQRGPVLFLQVDTPHALWKQRGQDISCGGYDMSNVWMASLLTIPYPFNIAEHEDILNDMVEKCRVEAGEEPAMIVFDTGRKLSLLDENGSDQMTMLMQALERVSGRQMAKILITHDKKGSAEGDQDADHESEGGDLMRGNRGSGAVAGAVDTVIKMTPKGYMYYQGRACGEQHKKLKFTHVYGEMGYMWEEDIDDTQEEARKLLTTYKRASERSLARMLANTRGIEEEKARGIIRRAKEKM